MQIQNMYHPKRTLFNYYLELYRANYFKNTFIFKKYYFKQPKIENN